MAKHTDFTTIDTEGGLLPSDLLKRLRDGDRDLPGLSPGDYHLVGHTRLTEAITEAWNKLQGAWATFQEARAKLPTGDLGTSVTRERWLLPLFQVLDYGRLQTSTADTIDGKSYPISHAWAHVPIHLVGCTVDLDTRTAGVAGAARTSPHGLVQSYLNASDEHLWGVASNGLKLRLLRDNHSLTRQAYLEYDLEAMFDGEMYPDFVLLYLTLHQSRFEADKPEACLLEQWSQLAQEQGARALDTLRDGVERAINTLGQGYLQQPTNQALRESLRDGGLTPQDYYRQLLRIVYRLLVLFAAEDRDLLHPPDASDDAKQRYSYYSTKRLRDVADAVPGGRHPDQYETLKRIWGWLGDEGAPDIALPALGGFLFSQRATPDLDPCQLTNRALLTAIRALAFTTQDGARLPIDYKNLGAEELGSIYESLLELHPDLDPNAPSFQLATAAGNERKTTGSYYTPTSLITLLLDSALDPVLDEADSKPEPEEALLDLRIVDPASGSGHFLIAAAQRTARRLARVRTGDDEPSPDATRHALRDVISHCIYGVDLNDMAAELCKVALWLEALEPGKPLTFLDHHIKTGNSLLGAPIDQPLTGLVGDGIPDDAYKPIQGDDPATARALKRRNAEERGGQARLFGASSEDPTEAVAQQLQALDTTSDDDIAAARQKRALYERLQTSTEYERARTIADAWTAAFVWPKRPQAPQAITSADLRALQEGKSLDLYRADQLARLRDQYRFFHWRLEYADVYDRPNAGFDVVLGNPPWDRIKLQEQEWFASHDTDIANAPNAAARNRLISKLETENPSLHEAFLNDLHKAEGESHLTRNSGNFPLCGRGDINTYALFAELDRNLINSTGRAGFIVPSGIATDSTTQFYFKDIMDRRSLISLYDFQSGPGLFSRIGHARFKFALVTLCGRIQRHAEDTEFAFYLRDVNHLKDDARTYTLSAEDINLLNPNTRTCPVFRTRRDAEITKAIYRRVPVLINETTDENPWDIRFMTMFHMSNDSGLFRTRDYLEGEGYELVGNRAVREGAAFLPLYEAKMVHQFDHRYATYTADGSIRDVTDDEHADRAYEPLPRYWVDSLEVERRLERRDKDGRIDWRWDEPWLLGFRDITNSTNMRTAIFSLIPRMAVGNNLPLCLPQAANLEDALLLLAAVTSFSFDFVTRQGAGGTHLNFFIVKQLPVPAPDDFEAEERAFIVPRVKELVATDRALGQAVRQAEPPAAWNTERRFWLRAELDAFFFHKYGVSRDDAAYMLETFHIVKRQDEKAHGCYRTRDAILEIYDEMARCSKAGEAYLSMLPRLPA